MKMTNHDVSAIGPAAFRRLPKPDYDGGSLLNLMASVIRSRGGRSPHEALRNLPVAELKRYRKVVLLLLDGIGAGQLRDWLGAEKAPSAFFGTHPHDVITTVCPATTASVVTLLATGASPAEHGILGWHLHMADLGIEGTFLPFVTRTGTPIAQDTFDLAKYLQMPSHLATTKGRRVLISPWGLPTSRTSMAQGWWHDRRSYTTLEGLVRRLRAFAKEETEGPDFAYAYWPKYDSLCHEFGPEGREPADHLRVLDGILARIERALRGTDTLLLVTADHGHMQTDITVDLSQIPGFYSTLSTLPSGDARMTHCLVRPSRERDFLRMLREEPLKSACVAVSRADFLASGILGPGKPHPALEDRMGDWVLCALPRHALAYPANVPPVPGEPVKPPMKGTHGGLSEAELRVPLFVVRP